jgi:RNA polymerase sigma-70 factor (ECF subfamily)
MHQTGREFQADLPEAHQLVTLIEEARGGNREAFQQLVAPYVDPAYRLAFTMLRQRQDAEDAIQESVLKAWTRLGQLRDGTSVKAWFFQIVVNECRMSRRGKWRSVIKLPQLPTQAARSEEKMIESTDLRRALTQLTDSERLVLFLSYDLDLDLEQVGSILGLSAAGARSRLYRAVRRLRPALGDTEAPS